MKRKSSESGLYDVLSKRVWAVISQSDDFVKRVKEIVAPKRIEEPSHTDLFKEWLDYLAGITGNAARGGGGVELEFKASHYSGSISGCDEGVVNVFVRRRLYGRFNTTWTVRLTFGGIYRQVFPESLNCEGTDLQRVLHEHIAFVSSEAEKKLGEHIEGEMFSVIESRTAIHLAKQAAVAVLKDILGCFEKDSVLYAKISLF